MHIQESILCGAQMGVFPNEHITISEPHLRLAYCYMDSICDEIFLAHN